MRPTKIIVFLVVLIFSASFILYLYYFKNRHQNPNIILITVDTLRADHLSSYGYQRATTPHIDQLAEDGTLFLHTIAQIPETLPSLCSIMTSSYPIDHGDFLYEDQIKVPLIISHPKLPKNQIVRSQVESVDIMPTIFDFIKVATEANLRGRSLLPLLYNEDEIDFEKFAFSESDICQESSPRLCSPIGIQGKLYSLRTGKWKYILDKNDQSELYNLLEDPLEMQNLIDEEKELAGLLDARIKSLIDGKDDKGEQSLSEETKEKLKSLGYL